MEEPIDATMTLKEVPRLAEAKLPDKWSFLIVDEIESDWPMPFTVVDNKVQAPISWLDAASRRELMLKIAMNQWDTYLVIWRCSEIVMREVVELGLQVNLK